MENSRSRESHTQIDDPPPLHRLSSSQSHSGSSSPSFAAMEEAQNENDQATAAEKLKMRFLAKNRENTWVVSLFVLLHLAAFATTMFVNNCWKVSHGDCSLGFLGRLSFQPLSENPLLGPSFSTLDTMGALRLKFLEAHHQKWRIFGWLWLHAGAFHLIINLFSLIFVGVHLEQKFGPWRIGIIYLLSALTGSLLAALFVQNTPAVCSSGALFGLIGASLSGLIQNWNSYMDKYVALIAIFIVFLINILLGLLPYVDNFANVGGLISGFLLGFVLFFSPYLREKAHHKGMFDYGIKRPVALRQKLDRPFLRGISLVLFCLIFACLGAAVFRPVNIGKICTWCHYLDCFPSRRWICEIKPYTCKTYILALCFGGLPSIVTTSAVCTFQSTVSGGRLTITCMSNDHFRNLPFTNISPKRLQELCVMICSY